MNGMVTHLNLRADQEGNYRDCQRISLAWLSRDAVRHPRHLPA
jgi:hypothetical protein